MFLHLTVLHWALNADMNKVDKIHPSSAFHENMLLYVSYIEENRQLEEQLRVAQRQILQLNREVLDLKEPRKFDHPCTGTNKPEII